MIGNEINRIDQIRLALELFCPPHSNKYYEDALDALELVDRELRELRMKEYRRIWNGDYDNLEAVPEPIYDDANTERLYG